MTSSPQPDRPYERHDEFDRYEGASIADLEAWQREDPLRFCADHVAAHDRRNRSAVVLIVDESGGPGIASVVHSTPQDPPAEVCYAIVDPFATVAGMDDLLVGLVLHRAGPDEPVASDERWQEALEAAAAEHGADLLGTVVRTVSGELVRVPPARW